MVKRLPGEFYSMVCLRDPNDDWNFPFFSHFEAAFAEAIAARAEAIVSELPETHVFEMVRKSIENAEQHRHMVWFAGEERIGKTTGAAALYRANPDRIRHVSLVASENDLMFYEVFARGIGCSIEPQDTAGDLQRKIVQAVQNRDQVLVLDEAHTLFGTGKRPMARRADWLRTAILNLGVPVVLIFTGLEFLKRLKLLRKSHEWNAKQFDGRRGGFYYAQKPTEDELIKIATHYLRGQCAEGAVTAAKAAIASEHRIPTVMRIANEASEIARRAGRAEITSSDVDIATGITLGFETLARDVEEGKPIRNGPQVPQEAPDLEDSKSASTPSTGAESPTFNRPAMPVQRGRKPAATEIQRGP